MPLAIKSIISTQDVYNFFKTQVMVYYNDVIFKTKVAIQLITMLLLTQRYTKYTYTDFLHILAAYSMLNH